MPVPAPEAQPPVPAPAPTCTPFTVAPLLCRMALSWVSPVRSSTTFVQNPPHPLKAPNQDLCCCQASVLSLTRLRPARCVSPGTAAGRLKFARHDGCWAELVPLKPSKQRACAHAQETDTDIDTACAEADRTPLCSQQAARHGVTLFTCPGTSFLRLGIESILRIWYVHACRVLRRVLQPRIC